jgi:hypothetical protein
MPAAGQRDWPRLRDELLNAWRVESLVWPWVFIEDWRCHDANRPHPAHGEIDTIDEGYDFSVLTEMLAWRSAQQ